MNFDDIDQIVEDYKAALWLRDTIGSKAEKVFNQRSDLTPSSTKLREYALQFIGKAPLSKIESVFAQKLKRLLWTDQYVIFALQHIIDGTMPGHPVIDEFVEQVRKRTQVIEKPLSDDPDIPF